MSLTKGEHQPPGGAMLRIDVYSHHIKLTRFNRKIKDDLLDFCRTIATYGLKRIRPGKFAPAMKKVYVGVKRDRSEFRFHINHTDEVVKHLTNLGLPSKNIWWVNHGIYEPERVEHKYIDPREPRGDQPAVIDYVLDPGKTKVVTLDPGMGKTYIANRIIMMMQTKAFFCIKSMYIDKWILDIKESFKVDKEDIVVIRGERAFSQVLHLAKEGKLNAKFILCSNMTYFNYLKTYESLGREILDIGWACLPEEMFELLGVGLRVIDEVHQDFHLNFRQDLYGHVPKTLSLSGSLESDDQNVRNMYNVMFPPAQRFHGAKRDVYAVAEAIFYHCPNVDNRIKYTNHALKSYSHVLFEQSIMKDKVLLKNYVDMVCDLVQSRYAATAQDGQKLAIYFATVDMCTIVSKELRRRVGAKEVTRYVSEDDYEEMLECDIIVTTLKSLGTAFDVPGLIMCIMTDSISSIQANIQVFGRLRRLKDWPDHTPEFLYLVCADIPKQMEYHDKKKQTFRDRVKAHKESYTKYHL